VLAFVLSVGNKIKKMLRIELDELDRKEFETVANYLELKHDELGKRKKDRTPESPKQLLQMVNTIRRALALVK
tara:strand:- start:585 stop:803 length:219 start_codon:yes stop_codon:yes gene_type:complete